MIVILSVVSASRSGALTESKDRAALRVITGASGSSLYALRSSLFARSILKTPFQFILAHVALGSFDFVSASLGAKQTLRSG